MKIELVRRKKDFITNVLRDYLGGVSGLVVVAMLILGMRLILDQKSLGWLFIAFVMSYVFWPIISTIREIKGLEKKYQMTYELSERCLYKNGNAANIEIKLRDIEFIIEKPWNFIIYSKNKDGNTRGELFLKNGIDVGEIDNFIKEIRKNISAFKEESVKGYRYNYK